MFGPVVYTNVMPTKITLLDLLTPNRSKRKKKRHEKKFHHLTPDSGHQSQHSTLSHIDPRGLPKVGNGLWVEAPAVYQAAPNQGMYYGRPNPKYRVEPGVQRSASELRLQGWLKLKIHAVKLKIKTRYSAAGNMF